MRVAGGNSPPEINCAAIFRDKGMSVAMFAAGIVELKTRAAGQQTAGMASWSSLAVSSSRPWRLAPRKGINASTGDVEDARSLTQTGLRTGEAYSTGIRKITCAP